LENTKVSVVIPTKNVETLLDRCLNSITKIDFPKDELEIIIVDGHSSDDTLEIARSYGCKILFEHIGTRAGACNVGVINAKGEFILFTDADCVVSKDWIKNLLMQFNKEDIASVGGPNITPEDDTDFAKYVGYVLSLLSKAGSRYGLDADYVMETFHNPGCNVAYRKKEIEEVGGFNEKLITCEDEELDFRIRKKGNRIIYTPHAKVYHYRRLTWKRFFKQAYSYATGRAQAIKLHRNMGKWFHYSPSIVIFLFTLFFILSYYYSIFQWLALSMFFGSFIIMSMVSIYLVYDTNKNKFFTFFGLLIFWFVGYGFGLFRGILK